MGVEALSLRVAGGVKEESPRDTSDSRLKAGTPDGRDLPVPVVSGCLQIGDGVQPSLTRDRVPPLCGGDDR